MFKRPVDFHYLAGQYVYIALVNSGTGRDEYHPFTLTSGNENRLVYVLLCACSVLFMSFSMLLCRVLLTQKNYSTFNYCTFSSVLDPYLLCPLFCDGSICLTKYSLLTIHTPSSQLPTRTICQYTSEPTKGGPR